VGKLYSRFNRHFERSEAIFLVISGTWHEKTESSVGLGLRRSGLRPIDQPDADQDDYSAEKGGE
jgi:hypothetical protein